MRVGVVTGTRAEYGLLRRLLMQLRDDPAFDLHLVVTGSHLVESLGGTIHEIEEDGFEIAARVDMLLASDRAAAVARSTGLATMGMADAVDRLGPDLVVVLGDRFEILAASQASMLCGVPVAHIHGGELTEGALDDALRHAVTKLSHLHFVATEDFRRRVVQLGEQPDRVHVVGALGLEAFTDSPPILLAELSDWVGRDLTPDFLLVTYHPATLAETPPETSLRELLQALVAFPERSVIITHPNADPGGRSLIPLLEEHARAHSNTVVVPSMGHARYVGAMRLAGAVLGNSSSGIIEAPTAGVPTVDIGDRQRGRPAAESVINCAGDTASIVNAIHQALEPGFRAVARKAKNPYGDGSASEAIMEVLRCTDPRSLLRKRFHDLTRAARLDRPGDAEPMEGT